MVEDRAVVPESRRGILKQRDNLFSYLPISRGLTLIDSKDRSDQVFHNGDTLRVAGRRPSDESTKQVELKVEGGQAGIYLQRIQYLLLSHGYSKKLFSYQGVGVGEASSFAKADPA